MENVRNFFFLGSKFTADGDYSHEIKKYIYIYIFAPWRKTYDPPRHPIQNQRHCVAKKGPPIQSYGFSNSHVWLHSWAIKKAGHQRIVTFLLCWRRLLRVPWTARRSNQSILKEIRPEY